MNRDRIRTIALASEDDIVPPTTCLSQTDQLVADGWSPQEHLIFRKEGPYVFIHQVTHCGEPASYGGAEGHEYWECVVCERQIRQTAPAAGIFPEIGNRIT